MVLCVTTIKLHGRTADALHKILGHRRPLVKYMPVKNTGQIRISVET